MANQSGGCLFAIIDLLMGKSQSPSQSNKRKGKKCSIHDEATEELPYTKKASILTTAEKNLYEVLTKLCGTKLVVLCQVNLREMFSIESNNWKKYGRALGQYSIDFVLCRASTMEPILSIELDDASHASKKRQERDHKIDRYHEAAGLPILHVPTAKTYDAKELANTIKSVLSS